MQPRPRGFLQQVVLRMGAAGLVLALAVRPAMAQSDGLEALVAEGIELRVQGKHMEALARFQRAIELAPQSVRARGHFALALHAVGDWLQAEKVMLSVLATPDDEWVERHTPELERSLNAVREHLAWMQIVAPGPGKAWIDGKAVGSLPIKAPVRVVAGRCVVEVQLSGRRPMRKEVDVGSGRQVQVTFATPQRAAPAAQTATPSAPRPYHQPAPAKQVKAPSNLRSYGLLSLGGGAVAMATGAALGIQALVLRDQRDDECDGSDCSAEGIRLDSRGRQAANLSGIMLSVGAVGLVTGSVLVWSDSRQSRSVELALRPGLHPDAHLRVAW